MEMTQFAMAVALGTIVGLLIGYLYGRGRAVRAEAAVQLLQGRVEELSSEKERLQKEADELREKRAQVVAPINQSLERLEDKLSSLSRERAGAFEALAQQVRALRDGASDLRKETGRLATALRAPGSRGKWGELQLRRVVELAGMVDHCDFYEQVHVEKEDGHQRPDMVIRMPGGPSVVVDAKVPLSDFLAAVESEDEDIRERKLLGHAKKVRGHIQALAKKSYWSQFEDTPEFVIMYLPGESIWSMALSVDGSLIEFGAQERVVVATPMTLIALLRAVAYGWRHETIEKNAQEISALGKELYHRLTEMAAHFAKMGKNLDRAVSSYNATVGEFEGRLLSTARRFEKLDAVSPSDELPKLRPVDRTSRPLAGEEE